MLCHLCHSETLGESNYCPDCESHAYREELAMLPKVGEYVSGSWMNADEFSIEIIDLAKEYGFKPELDEEFFEQGEENEDYSQILSEVSDEAVEYLNSLPRRDHTYWTIEESSLFLCADIEGAKEEVSFCNSRNCEEPDSEYRGNWLSVSDHGNVALYCRLADGSDCEIWAVV